MSIIIAFFIFSLIILFHEFGHFLLAKKNGVTVVEFSLGMGPRLLSRQWHGTRYSLKLLPFGGSCMMLGEDEAADEPGTFGSKSVWARISVIAAGPIFNFLMAFLLAVIVVALRGYDPAVITDAEQGFPAREAGLQAGDIITGINGKTIHMRGEATDYISFHPAESYTISYKRDGKKYTADVAVKTDDEGRQRIGISMGLGYIKGNALTCLRYGVYEVKYWIDLTFTSLKMMLQGQVGLKDMSGPVGVVSAIGGVYSQSADRGLLTVMINMLNMAILLSANIGVMNLLPLPALDGGRLVFLILEAIRGKRVNPEKEAMVHFVGIMALMVLMVVVMYNDVMRLI